MEKSLKDRKDDMYKNKFYCLSLYYSQKKKKKDAPGAPGYLVISMNKCSEPQRAIDSTCAV